MIVNQEPISRLKKAYVVFFITILALLIGHWALNQYQLDGKLGDSRLINASGRQRMLSQQIVKVLLLMERDSNRSISGIKAQTLELISSYWDEIHKNLKNGILGPDLRYTQSSRVRELFELLDKEQKSLMAHIAKIIAEYRENSLNLKQKIMFDMEEIILKENKFLDLMDDLTFQFEIESTAKLEDFKILQHIMLALTLAIVLIQFILLFLPTARNLFWTFRRLKESEQKYKELSQTKDKFFSIISHDLRGPIGTLANFFEYFLQNKLPENEAKIKEIFRSMAESLGRVYALLENLLQWAGSQTGQIAYLPDRLPLDALSLEVVALYTKRAEEKGIRIINRVQEIRAFADLQMVSTVLRNLLSNALKFTPLGGEIVLDCVEQEREAIYCVQDTGTGMDQNALQKVFRLDTSYSTKGTENESGTGLGLILCKDFIEKNGGRIWVESERGKGTKVSFSLPLKESDFAQGEID